TRNHRLNVTAGKSDHATLTRASNSSAIRAELREKKKSQLKRRKLKKMIANKMSPKRMPRSNAFPSSRAWAAGLTSSPPSHCSGSRDPIMNSQVKGTQSADEVPETLAGSKRNSAKRRI